MNHPKLTFEVLEDNSLSEIIHGGSADRRLLSLTNDFEEGQWRHDHFLKFVLDHIGETALSEEERGKAVGMNFYSALIEAISRLRKVNNDKGKGGEIAEILLYGIMREYFSALPVVPKIFYKQNDNDNAKGADSVHIILEDDGRFSLWLGEAKFYNSIDNSRLDDPVESVLNTLEKRTLKKEASVLTNIKDLDLLIPSPSVRGQIKEALSPNTSIDKIRALLHIPILLLHECEITSIATAMTEEFKNKLKEKHRKSAQAYFSKLDANNSKRESSIYKLDEIKFHLILFPVPNKEVILKKFYDKVNAIII